MGDRRGRFGEVFYALVVDLTGAPQEFVDPDKGTVTGWEYGLLDPVCAATPSGYVSSNPVLWLTRTNSKYAPTISVSFRG